MNPLDCRKVRVKCSWHFSSRLSLTSSRLVSIKEPLSKPPVNSATVTGDTERWRGEVVASQWWKGNQWGKSTSSSSRASRGFPPHNKSTDQAQLSCKKHCFFQLYKHSWLYMTGRNRGLSKLRTFKCLYEFDGQIEGNLFYYDGYKMRHGGWEEWILSGEAIGLKVSEALTFPELKNVG